MPTLDLGPIFRSLVRGKARFLLLTLEVALTLAIVVNCVAIISDARRKMGRASGFDDDNIVVVQSTPFDPAFKEEAFRDARLRKDLEILRAIPGVRCAGATYFLPWAGGGSSTEMKVEGKPGEQMFRTQIYPIDESVIDALGIQVVAGKGFTRDDVDRDTERLRKLLAADRPPREKREPFRQDVVVTRALAELEFPGESALGKAFEDPDGDLYPIVGVVDPFYNPYGWPIHEYSVFYATIPSGRDGGSQILVRTEPGATAAIGPLLEKALLDANPGRTFRVRPLTQIRTQYFAGTSATIWMVTVVIFLLVFVTCLGILGVTSFSVAERTKQIGTRRALGARRADIVRHFLLENAILTAIGGALGVALAYALNWGLVTFVTGPKLEPLTVVAGLALLAATGFGATLAPAIRAASVSPAIATRSV